MLILFNLPYKSSQASQNMERESPAKITFKKYNKFKAKSKNSQKIFKVKSRKNSKNSFKNKKKVERNFHYRTFQLSSFPDSLDL